MSGSTANNEKDSICNAETAERIKNSKTRSTYYTSEKIAAARLNVQKYDWARKIRDDAVEKADSYIKLGLDYLWDCVTPQSIPRSYAVNQPLGCLNCGKQVDKYGNYPYTADPVKHPWKLECPNCHMKFPTNDFEAYYKSGKDCRGIFDPALADRSLLKNILYPEKGEKWGVDDGYGYRDENGRAYTIIAYYNHWFIWCGGIVDNALSSLMNAYIYTGEAKYACAGIVLLDRIADVYPAMDIWPYKMADGFLNSDGCTNMGKIIGSIWETGLATGFLHAYDAFFPAMDQPEAIGFLSRKADQYGLGILKKSAAGIRKNIEDGIVRQIYPAVKKGAIRGNNGMHQNTLATAAVVLDAMPETKEWLDFNFKTGVCLPGEVTGGSMSATFVNDIDRDGHGAEAAPGYNSLWLSQFLNVADTLQGYDLYPAADLYRNIKFEKMFTAMCQLMLTDSFSALIGDSGKTGNPLHYLNISHYIKAFEQYGDPVFARIVYFLNGNTTSGIHGDIFSSNPEKIAEDIKKVIEEKGELKLDSRNYTGYGLAVLRDGSAPRGNFGSNSSSGFIANPAQYTPPDGDAGERKRKNADTQRAFWMYYGRNRGHGHADTLNIGCIAFKLDLMPELGYPEYCDHTPNRTEWILSTISHNTVVVDKARQSPQIVGQPRHFGDKGTVKLADVEAPRVYEQTSQYRRTMVMVKVDEENSYAVDFFRVKGGNEHHFSFHSAEGAVSVQGLKLVPQVDARGNYVGSYAGKDVEFGKRTPEDSVHGSEYTGPGFHWLKNVDWDRNPESVFSVDWQVKDTWNMLGNGAGEDSGVHMRLTMLGQADDIALADGIPPRNKPGNPASLRYVLVHRCGKGLDSLFTSVFEPYRGERYIESVTPAVLKLEGRMADSSDAKAVKVKFKNGRTDYIIYASDSSIAYTVDDKFLFKGFVGVYSEMKGKPVYAYINDGETLGSLICGATPRLRGNVIDFTRELSRNNQITVQLDMKGVNANELIGMYIYIENDGIRNASYRIEGINSHDGDRLELDIGDVTPVRSWKDSGDFSKGYEYDFKAGAGFVIPLSYEYMEEWG